jgi:arsenate reductase-like glutaredoxin family protein
MEKNNSALFIISISSCKPCIKTKKIFDKHEVHYNSIDVNNASQNQIETVLDIFDEVLPSKGLPKIYPIIVVENEEMIQGYDKEKLLNLVKKLKE